eukprot:jgi/Chlat1/6264/Chrsp44S09049
MLRLQLEGQHWEHACLAQICFRSALVHDLVEKALIPYMEQKIRNLHHQVSSSRKGLKSRITSLWGIRKEKKETEADSNNSSNAYSTSSTEWQLRLLGDYAFMLRDYDLALNNYRQLSSDYKSDRAWKHYAGVQELMGLAAFMLDEHHRESLPCFELAYTFYQRSGQLGTRYATRTALLLVEVLKAKRQYREAALVLTRASLEENNLRSGVLMEQAALCFLRLVPLSVRKYSFHMVLAGNRYNQCSQRKHAVRAYTQVLGVYASRGWAYIDDHVHFALGRQAAHLGDFPGAVQYFMKLLACGHQPAATQATYLREFLYVYQQAAEKTGVLAPLPLQLPVIDTGRVTVHFQDYRCHASDAAASVPDDVWADLEEPLISPGFQETLSTWMDRGSAARLQSAIEEQTNLTVAGEEVGIDVEFYNCLKIPVSVSDVRLLWTWTRPTKRSSRVHSVQGLNNDLLAPDSDTEEDTSGAVEAPAAAFSLKGGERTKVRLTIKPLKEGKVNVIGVDWLLSEVARGRQMFAIRGPLKKKQKEGGQDRDYPPHMRLAFRVIQSMPRLEARIHELPSAVVQGELRRFVMELSNTGPASLKSLRMRSSHPAEVCAGEENDLDVEFSHCLSPSRHGRQNKNAKGGAESRGIIEFLAGGSLGGGSTLLWPLWLRMCSTGLQTVHLAFYYEAHAGTSVMKYRTLRVVCSLTVVASLKASARLLPSPTSLDRHLLRVDVHNLHLASGFFINQVTAMPEQWQLLPLEESSSDSWSSSTKEAPLIRPGEPAYAELASVGFGEQQQNGTGHPCELHLSSSIGTHVDLDAGPAHSFYLAERRLIALPGNASTTGRREDDLDVLFAWEVAGEPGAPRAGSLNVYGLSTRGPAPVRWALQGDSVIDHDFSSHSSCRAPLLFEVRNCSSTSVSVCLETSNPTAEPAAAADSGGWFAINSPQGAAADTAASGAVSPTLPPVVSYAAITKHAERRDIGDLGSRMGVMPLTPYVWCGPSRVTLNHLPPGEQASIPLCAALFAPGVYDFSSYRVSWFVNNESAPSTPATPIADGAEGLDGNGSSVGQSFLVRVSDSRQEAKAAASTKSLSIAQQLDAFNVPPPSAAVLTHRQSAEPLSLLDL